MKTKPAVFRCRLSQSLISLQTWTICPACAVRRVRHKSDYPSNVKPFASQNRKDRDIDSAQYFTEVARKDNKMLYCYFTRAKHQTALLKKHGVNLPSSRIWKAVNTWIL